MSENIIVHAEVLKAPEPHILNFEAATADGKRCQAAVATGIVPMSLAGRTHSLTHNLEIDIALPFLAASHVVSLAPRGHELRGLARFGFRRSGWSIVDYSSEALESAVRVNLSLWVNNAEAWTLGVIYNCTALSAAIETD